MKQSFLRYIAQTSDTPMGLEVAHAKNEFIYTTDQQRYIDFISGIAVSSLGHNHPRVVDAVCDQVRRHMHVMVYGEFVQDAQVKLASRLLQMLPPGLDRIYYTNSGTEANEGALKLAKKFTKRHHLVAFTNSYHGDTHGSLSVTGRDVYRNPFLPLLPDVTFLDFNNHVQLDAITEKTACVILEPIQGEGGILPAEKKWLEKLRKRCDLVGALLIFDEIQSGFGRTGKLFAFQHYGIQPDILTMAKAMGGGMPLGGIVSSDVIFSEFSSNPPLNHVTTFGGHPVSCAASLAALEVLVSENLIDRAGEIETFIRNHIHGSGIVEIRGKGAMLGLQLETFELTKYVVHRCFENGIILGWTLHSDTLIRLAPPLIITNESLKNVCDMISDSLTSYYSS